MVYFKIFLTLLFLAIVEYYSKTIYIKKNLFYISGGIILLFCSLRAGVGFDYESYNYIYDSLPSTLFSKRVLEGIKGDFLFLQYFIILKTLGIKYIYASSITIAIIVILFLRFIDKYSEYKCFSLLILFSWYFVYIFSTLRQGMALALVFGIGIPFFEKGKYLKYLSVILVAFFFHSSSIICAILPLASKLSFLKSRNYVLLALASLLIANIFSSILTNIVTIFDKEIDSSLSLGALINRGLAVLIVYLGCKPSDTFLSKIKNIYLLGFLIYLFLSGYELIASRVAVYFKLFEIVLFPAIIGRIPRKYYPLVIAPLAVYLGFMLMNIIGAIADVNSYPDAWSYPYTTIFEYINLYQ